MIRVDEHPYLTSLKAMARGSGAPNAGPGLADEAHPKDNNNMSTQPTRPELDAKLENVGLTLDRRIDGIEAKLDGLKSDVASTKSTVMWMAALIVGTVVATAGLVVTSFDSGRDTAEMAAQARADTTAALLEIRQAVDEIKAHRPPAEQSTQ